MTRQKTWKLYEAKICPACGFQLDFMPWNGESARDEICPSCGIQFGHDDHAGGDLSGRIPVYLNWRIRWIDSGMKWWSKRDVPDDWNPKTQMEKLDTIF